MATASGHHDYLRHDPLQEVATPHLYRANAFRVLRLPVTVDGAQISRQQKTREKMQKLGIAPPPDDSGPLPLKPPPNAEELRRAGQRLHDMQSRIVDELFWFWPTDHNNGEADAAYRAACEGRVRDAHELWRQQRKQPATEAVAVHNLAALYHALALDVEHASTGEVALVDTTDETRRDKYWTLALQHWSSFADSEAGWNTILSRAEALDDPRLTSGFVRRLRHALPEAILSINITLAVRAAKRGRVDEAKRHLSYVRNSGFDLHMATSLLEREAAPLVEQIRRICEPVADRSKASPETANQLARSVLRNRQLLLLLTAIRALFGRKHYLRHTAFDLVASTVRGCMIDYGNATEDWDGCTPILQHAASLALDDGLFDRLQGDIAQAEENKKAKENDLTITLVDRAVKAARAGRLDHGRRMLQEALATCKDPELAQEIEQLILATIGAPQRTAREPIAPQEAARDRSAPYLTGRYLGQAIRSVVSQLSTAGRSAAREDGEEARSQLTVAAIGIMVVFCVFMLIVGVAELYSGRSAPSDSPPPLSTPSPSDTLPETSASAPGDTPHETSTPLPTYTPPIRVTPSPAYTPPRRSAPSRPDTGLSKRIDAGKARARALETEIDEMDSQLESLSASIARYKREIEGYESQARSGLRVDRDSYEQALADHNRLVDQHNALLERRNAKHKQYKQEIDSVNDMVDRYNRGAR